MPVVISKAITQVSKSDLVIIDVSDIIPVKKVLGLEVPGC